MEQGRTSHCATANCNANENAKEQRKGEPVSQSLLPLYLTQKAEHTYPPCSKREGSKSRKGATGKSCRDYDIGKLIGIFSNIDNVVRGIWIPEPSGLRSSLNTSE